MFAPGISRTLNIDRERRARLNQAQKEAPENGGSYYYRAGRRIQNQRRWSLTSPRYGRQLKRQNNPPVMWNIQGVRGKMPANCLWHACQAFCVGVLLFTAGFVMSYMGFEADGVFSSNGTAVAGGRAYFYEDARGNNVRFSKLSYIGPIVMGVGGFIIISSLVITFEARDSAAKVGPAAYVASEDTSIPYPVIPQPRPVLRRKAVRSVGTQTMDHTSSDTLHNIFDKKHLLETFRKFSKTVRQSSSKEDEMQRYPSAPNLLEEEDETQASSVPKPAAIAARRSSCLPKFRNRVPPVLIKKAMSIDCSSSSPFLPPVQSTTTSHSQSLLTSTTPSTGRGRKAVYISDVRRGSGDRLSVSPNSQASSRAMSSRSMDNSGNLGLPPSRGAGGQGSSSGTVDLHLPNGVVTLNVVHTTGGSMLGGSSTCLRTISPHPSFRSQSDDSSFEAGSFPSESSLMPRSPMKPIRYRSESFGRPALVRQSKVDQPEIIYMPDSDEEQQQPIPEAEHESDTDTE